ncbi:Retrotransposable element Tf2 [Senna tora]|uniref:Retrotransposable element Tf2 n=1 Tax=Senna tora TaxID=362788 RepID=A0A834VXE6_9FABA|nr:Retrotransposable element Tf2 [Senna tora]
MMDAVPSDQAVPKELFSIMEWVPSTLYHKRLRQGLRWTKLEARDRDGGVEQHGDADESETHSNRGDETVQNKGPGKFKKHKIPVFEGQDPIGWLFKGERYFDINKVEKSKMEAAAMRLEGRALNWYQWPESHPSLQKETIPGYCATTLEEDLEKGNEVLEESKEGAIVELSMNSVVGITSNNTMKVLGKCPGEEVVVLIDNGASRNFVALEVVERLGIGVKRVRAFEVSLEDGYKITWNQMCSSMELEIQGMKVRQPFHLFDFGGANLVLGIDWVKSSVR